MMHTAVAVLSRGSEEECTHGWVGKMCIYAGTCNFTLCIYAIYSSSSSAVPWNI